MIEAIDISKRFSSHLVFSGLSFKPRPSQLTAVIGPSGAGKSTLFRCLCALEPITDGCISIDGGQIVPTTERDSAVAEAVRRRVGLVAQSPSLWPYRTVFDNLAAGPRFVLRKSPDEVRSEINAIASRLNVADQLCKYPTELSGGQQQRVALGRAMAMRPEALLLDEATSWLDPEAAHDVLMLLRQEAAAGKTIVLVSHQIELLLRHADVVYLLSNGQFRLEGSPQDIFSGRCSSSCAEFLRRIGMFR